MKQVWMLFLLSACGVQQNSQPSSFSPENEVRSDSLFIWGTSDAPALIPPGPGAGEWNSEPASAENIMLARSARAYLATRDARQRYGVEAAGTFLHYFKNTGVDYPLSVDGFRTDVPRAAGLYDDLIAQVVSEAKDVLTRASAPVLFTMRTAPVSTVERVESENWYLAVAGFSYWISGALHLDMEGQVRGRIAMHLWDQYDWDPGVVIPISTPFGTIDIDQDRVGEFHRQGLAKEYASVGTAFRDL